MHKKENNNTIIKATIKNIVVAFIYVLIIVLTIAILFSSPISKAISLINTVSIDTSKKIQSDVKIDLEHNKLQSYPEYGTRYGTIIIDSIDVNLPLYFGDTLSILMYGVGQSASGYFPGEGGSVICMGHRDRGYLRRLPEMKKGDKIRIETVYGNYTYTLQETKVVKQTQLDAVPIQKEKEMLILYTCYPINTIGHATQRFITYSTLD